ncbi:Pentatricopeptide repeat-containing protein At2g01390 [Linum perenne]
MFRPNGFKTFPLRHLSFFRAAHSGHLSDRRKPIKRFSKASRKPSNLAVKRELEVPNSYMRNTVSSIYGILKYSDWETAQQQLQNLHIKWDSYTVNKVLKTHPPMEKAWLFFNWAASKLVGFKHDRFTYTTMLDIFGEAGRMESMLQVFDEMRKRGIDTDAATYTSLMHWVSKSGDVDKVVKIWTEMKEYGCRPTVVSYTAYMKILFDSGRVKEATNVYWEMLEVGITPNCYTYTVLMEHLVVAGKCQEAVNIFNTMQEAGVDPDKAACNILIQKCCVMGETKTMIPILYYMKEHGLVLRYSVFLEALETLQVAGESDSLLREVNPHCVATECVSNEEISVSTTSSHDHLDGGLVQILLAKKSFVAVDWLLTGMIDKSLPLDSWIVSYIIERNCDHCKQDGALLAFEYSRKMGVGLSRTAYLCLTGSLMRSNMFDKLGKARRPTCAAKLFALLPDDEICTATYTALVSVYFSAGTAEKALKTFETMKKKAVSPSLGTYNILLMGLEKLGRGTELEVYRKERKSLLIHGHHQGSLPLEEKICDVLFAESSVT